MQAPSSVDTPVSHSATLPTTTLITGASSGIGLEMARLLAARGHRLVLASRGVQRLREVGDELHRQHGVEVHCLPIDLSEAGAAQRLFNATRQLGLEIDMLVNNAGVGMVEAHLDMDPLFLERMLQLNVVAVAELCHRFGGQMRRRGAGRILNVASAAAYQPTPYFGAYGASKAFVLNFSEALAKELEDDGVSVSCLSPGPTDTAFFDGVDPGRIGDGHHFGKASRYKAVDVARAGVELMLTGGLSRVVGPGSRALVFANRFAPRAMVAALSKRLLRPTDAQR